MKTAVIWLRLTSRARLSTVNCQLFFVFAVNCRL